MARLHALIGTIAISFSAILVRAADVSPGTSALFRTAYALVPLAILATLPRAGWLMPRRAHVLAALAGVFFAVDLNLWHRSIAYVGAGLATVLGNLQVVLVGLAAWIVHRERPTSVGLAAVPVALVGVALAAGLGRADAYGTDPPLGALLGVLTAAAYTVFLLAVREIGRDGVHPATMLLYATLSATAANLVLGVWLDDGLSLAPEWPSHGWLVLLGVGAHTFGWLAIATALPRLPALDTSLVLLVQPCLTVLWGVVIFGEAPSVIQWAGIAVVLTAVVGAGVAGGTARKATVPPPP